MKLKKILVLLIVELMICSTVACYGEETDSKKSENKVEESDDKDDADDAVVNHNPSNTILDNVAGISKFDINSFDLNNKIYQVGVTTLQEMIDDGVPITITDIANVDANVKPNDKAGYFIIILDDYNKVYISATNFSDSVCKINDCVISSVFFRVTFIHENNGIIFFALPFTITEDKLIEYFDEPKEPFVDIISDNYILHDYQYQIVSNYPMFYEFEFENGELSSIYIKRES